MKKALWIVLLALPQVVFPAICRTTGADGVANFVDVPGDTCPPGYTFVKGTAPDTQDARPGVRPPDDSAQQAADANYRSIRIIAPQAGAVVRVRSLVVVVDLQPDLQPDHFVTLYLDGHAHRGAYGSSEVELPNLGRGTHQLYATVTNSRGRVLVESDEISFTVQLKANAVIGVDPIGGDDYLGLGDTTTDGGVEVTGTYRGPAAPAPGEIDATRIVLYFPDGSSTPPVAVKDGRWTVVVPMPLLGWGQLEARAGMMKGGYFMLSGPSSKKRFGVHPSLFPGYRGNYVPSNPANYSPAGPAEYTAPRQGISTTPGQTNPAFMPRYSR